jgi:hypothetical protein
MVFETSKALYDSKGEAITMKNKSFLWFITGLMAVFLTIPRTASAQDERRYEKREESPEREGEKYGKEDRSRLEGTWYLNGERDKPCEIVSTRGGFEARNERGDSSPLVYDRDGSIRARDWEGGLRGEVRGDRIVWGNGTTWTRVASRR